MNARIVAGLWAGAMVMALASGTGLAQNAGGSTGGSGSTPYLSAGTSTATSRPAPRTGVRKPPPGPAPQGSAAQVTLPDCFPPSCGTPLIMGPARARR
ncbi:hypothetical protein FHS55_003631 [Angulomicrobium tetraedrale]|uniref:Uncharacterized protein n=1 Tax=Ancylobacter tetraedralis TaxID=217068 RepID=A0A839ZEC0_9HYPH|nr:hypothetical protein [Ancylobacter tetraedralis]MBB3773006.1 hypothetical protein [Ancylobacter tetraedralis]